MSKWYWLVAAIVVAAIAIVTSMRWGDSSRAANNVLNGVASSDNATGSLGSLPLTDSAVPHGVNMLVNAERSAEIRRRLVELSGAAIRVDAGTVGAPSAQLGALSPGRLTEDVEAYDPPLVGGVVDSAEVRKESTLRDPSLETCLRESFLAVYFDPPPQGGQITMRFPFRFEGGEVDTSHEVHLTDKRD